ncbi:hypothetical protein ARHIZOSPH14_14130 [Agromyces rhizosphaerae]|uniref:DUF2510 domain-containing protein n=1 Tax=Agromyces rhizosphaerae TaxID=88374 RepID=A0A9W6CW63_9MICO|nr:DUF2510 domain-containing protein [Agromyces rhizosphaerae]GLI27171.1 hypothetical protein ARHIZOSPH14_14130 [Agromyces rhizosphaerae]
MSEPTTHVLPKPGWYPDPNGSGRRRWWTGLGWSDKYAEAGQLGGLSRSISSSKQSLYGEWIWLVVALPYVPMLGLFLVDWTQYFALATSPNPDMVELAPVQLFTDPAYLFLLISGFVVPVLVIAFAAADRARLRRLGLQQPFHWAWTLVSVLVYVIGRSVVVHQAAGRGGLAPIWVLLGLMVLNVVVAVQFTLWILQIVYVALF